MWFTVRVLALASLLFGLAATGTLSLAVAVGLFTSEPIQIEFNGTIFESFAMFHSGLWRACPYWAGKYQLT